LVKDRSEWQEEIRKSRASSGCQPDTYLCITGFAHSYSGAGKVVPCTIRSAGCGKVDAVAKDIIARKGLGKWFTHRLGHGTWCDTLKLLPESVLTDYPGIGLQIHKHRIHVVITALDSPSEAPFPMSRESTIRARWDFLLSVAYKVLADA